MAKKRQTSEDELFQTDDTSGGLFGDDPQPDEAPIPSALAADEPDDAPGLFPEEKRPAPPQREGYVVLARRYRPQTFDQIVGQESVQKSLRGAIEGGNIGHAYLFAGPRGTGKTSTARILAKALNCQEGGPRPDPCGKCDSCKMIAAGSSLDVIEIDAASNTGVDNIRDLRSGVVLAPFSRFKVYIIDEVHMLSNQAFNALLKTLEEPPSQVVFILATTELQKVPETIVSRCQTSQFRRFSVSEIAKQLDKILTKELERRKVKVDPEDRVRILDLISRNAEGGMRDAQVSLDQVLVLAHDKLDFDTVRRFLGHVQNDILDAFIQALYDRRTQDLLLMIDELVNGGQDLERFVKTFSDHLRDLLILRTAPANPGLVNAADDRLRAMRQLADNLSTSFLLSAASAMLRLSEEMKQSGQSRFLLEFAIIRLTQVEVVDDIGKMSARLQEIEKAVASGGGVAPRVAAPPQVEARPKPAAMSSSKIAEPPAPQAYAATPAPAVAPAPVPAPQAAPAQPTPAPVPIAQAETLTTSSASAPVASISPEEFMCGLREKTVNRSSYLHLTLLDSVVLEISGNTILLGVNAADKLGHGLLAKAQNQEILREVCREIAGRDMIIKVQLVAGMPKAAQPIIDPVAPAATSAPAPVLSAQLAVTAIPAVSAPAAVPVEEEHEMEIYYSPEIRKLSERVYKGSALRDFVEKHADLKEVMDKLKETFKLEDSQITFRARAL